MTDLKRRRNGTGTKPHRRPGRSGWYCRIRVTDPVSGDHRRVVLSAPTKAELLEKRKAVARRTGAGLPAAASRVTVAGYAEEWVANHLPAREVAEGTRRLYRRMIKNHVVPQLGGLRLSSVRPVDVERLDAHLRSCGLSDSTRRSVRNVLSVMYSTAVRDGLVAANPTGLVPRPTERRVRRPQYDPAELERLFGAVAGERILGQLVPLLGWTALRIGEALALRWEDLSLDGPVPLLWVTGTRVDAPGTVGVRQPFPKDEEPRPVPLVPEAVAALRARWVEQAGEMLAAGDGWANPDGLVFTSRSGGMVEARNLRRRYARVLRQAGLAGSFHALRRSTATMLTAAGVPLNVVSAILGHSSSAVTEQRYVVVNTDMVAQAMSQLSAHYEAARSTVSNSPGSPVHSLGQGA